MAAKPTDVPTFATGTTLGVDRVEPSAGKKVLGWLPDERPGPEYFNWLQKLYGEWLQYLSDGALSGAHSFSGLITASAGLTAAANQHITVSGTGRFKHGNQVKNIAPQSGEGTGFSAAINTGYIESTGSGHIIIPLNLETGERLVGVTINVKGNGGATGDWNGYAYKYNASAVSTTLASVVVTNEPNSWRADSTMAGGGMTAHTVTDGDAEVVQIDWNEAGLRIGTIQVTYDRP